MQLPTTFVMMVLGVLLVITLISCLCAPKYFGRFAHMRKLVFVFNLILFALWRISYTNYFPAAVNGVLNQVIILCIILQIIMAIVAGVLSLIMFIVGLIHKEQAPNAGRRNFLRALIWLPSLSLTAYGGLYEAKHIEYTNLNVPTNSPKMNGLKAVQLSDVHLGNYFSLEKLTDTLNDILKLNPDILLITGDIFDDVSINDEAIKIISDFAPSFPLGAYYCWGNHEHFRGIPHLQEQLAQSNIKLLNNDAVKVLDDTVPLYVLGVDYLSGGDEFASQRETYLMQAMANVPDNSYKILLAHHPIFFDNAFAHKINLTLSGHTHGGQFAILDNPLFPVFKYMMGKFSQGDYIGYVNRGAGSWFPCRIGCPPEITIVNFTYRA